MTKEIARQLVTAIRAQKGPLPKELCDAHGRWCAYGLLLTKVLPLIPGGGAITLAEQCKLVRINNTQPKARVIALVREMGR